MRVLTAIILLLLVFAGCGKDKQPQIPYVYVNKILYPNTMDYIPISGYLYVNEGYRGIIVYRVSQDEFMVYERCCPYDPEKTGARVSVDASGFMCVDSVCMSKFNLPYGIVESGPSPYSLMQYRWNYDSEVLYIYN